MNSKQIKHAISRFRSADVSIIKDDATRAKAQTLQAKQKGFTLLELLIVITILATLATAALVAYEGIGENAEATASANNLLAAESSIRNFRAIENVYPNQWDNLANLDGDVSTGAASLLAPATKAFFGQWTIPGAQAPTGTVWGAVINSLNNVGIDELQTLQSTSTFRADNIPNLAFNESNPAADVDPAAELEFEFDTTLAIPAYVVEYAGTQPAAASISIVPAGAAGTCTADGASLTSTLDGTLLTTSQALNLINDGLGDDGCHLVLALGFGKDVPGTTLGSRVAIAQVPTAASDNVNPSVNYARYIALFHMGSADEDGATPTVIQPDEILAKPRLIGIVDAEGKFIDQALAGANTI